MPRLIARKLRRQAPQQGAPALGVRRGLFQIGIETGKRAELAQEGVPRLALVGLQRRKARHLIPQQVIRNLVGDAVATQAAIEELADDDPALFRVDGLSTLHHGRFSAGDRRRLDRAVENAIGRERPDGP